MNWRWKGKSSRRKWVSLLVVVFSLAVMTALAGAGSLTPSTPSTTQRVNLASGAFVNLGYVFGNFTPPGLCGYKYHDLNGNGKRDPNELGLSGVLVTLQGTDGMGRSVSLSTITGPDGSFSFNNLWPGNYSVTEHPGKAIPSGTPPWTPCTPSETPPPPEVPCNATCIETPYEIPPQRGVPCNATCIATAPEAPWQRGVPCNATCTSTPPWHHGAWSLSKSLP